MNHIQLIYIINICQSVTCNKCSKKHHTLLHFDGEVKANVEKNNVIENESNCIPSVNVSVNATFNEPFRMFY